MDTLYIVIPAYNESENIKRTIEEWCPVVEKHNGGGASRLVIINDGSRDDTYEIASAECETRPLLTVLTKPNGGHGSTVLYGYRYALENGADYIFQTDSDGQTDPAEFEKFWQIREATTPFSETAQAAATAFPRCRGKSAVRGALDLFPRIRAGCKCPVPSDENRLRGRVSAADAGKLQSAERTDDCLRSVFSPENPFHPDQLQAASGGTNSINIRKIVKIGRQALHDFCEIQKAAAKKRG